MNRLLAELIILFTGITCLAVAVVGLWNSSLDSREWLLVTMLGAGCLFIGLGIWRWVLEHARD